MSDVVFVCVCVIEGRLCESLPSLLAGYTHNAGFAFFLTDLMKRGV